MRTVHYGKKHTQEYIKNEYNNYKLELLFIKS